MEGDGGEDVQGGIPVRAGEAGGEADDEHGGEYVGRAFGNSYSGVSLRLDVPSIGVNSVRFQKGVHQDRHMIDLFFVKVKKSFRLLLLFYINVLPYAVFIKTCLVMTLLMYEMN